MMKQFIYGPDVARLFDDAEAALALAGTPRSGRVDRRLCWRVA